MNCNYNTLKRLNWESQQNSFPWRFKSWELNSRIFVAVSSPSPSQKNVHARITRSDADNTTFHDEHVANSGVFSHAVPHETELGDETAPHDESSMPSSSKCNTVPINNLPPVSLDTASSDQIAVSSPSPSQKNDDVTFDDENKIAIGESEFNDFDTESPPPPSTKSFAATQRKRPPPAAQAVAEDDDDDGRTGRGHTHGTGTSTPDADESTQGHERTPPTSAIIDEPVNKITGVLGDDVDLNLSDISPVVHTNDGVECKDRRESDAVESMTIARAESSNEIKDFGNSSSKKSDPYKVQPIFGPIKEIIIKIER